jgi:hypothetical protein
MPRNRRQIRFSALLFCGPPDDILTLARDGKIHLTISDDIIDEVSRVFTEKRMAVASCGSGYRAHR